MAGDQAQQDILYPILLRSLLPTFNQVQEAANFVQVRGHDPSG
jgi:hypothetical protein